jgi:hypothetical protein
MHEAITVAKFIKNSRTPRLRYANLRFRWFQTKDLHQQFGLSYELMAFLIQAAMDGFQYFSKQDQLHIQCLTVIIIS